MSTSSRHWKRAEVSTHRIAQKQRLRLVHDGTMSKTDANEKHRNMTHLFCNWSNNCNDGKVPKTNKNKKHRKLAHKQRLR